MPSWVLVFSAADRITYEYWRPYLFGVHPDLDSTIRLLDGAFNGDPGNLLYLRITINQHFQYHSSGRASGLESVEDAIDTSGMWGCHRHEVCPFVPMVDQNEHWVSLLRAWLHTMHDRTVPGAQGLLTDLFQVAPDAPYAPVKLPLNELYSRPLPLP